MLVNGWRRHQTALVNNFTYGMGAGSSGVDLNAIPSSALDRIEVLRDGAAAQYGSDAIAGVVNLVLKDGAFSPFLNGDVGRYTTDDYPDDGTTVNVNGGWGIGGRPRLARPSSASSATGSRPTGPGPIAFEDAGTGVADSIDNDNGQVIEKRNPVPQPNHHWGDGLEKDALTFANFRMPLNDAGTHRDLQLRRLQPPRRQRQRLPPLRRQRAQLAARSTRSATCPTFSGTVTDYSAAGGRARAWCRGGTTTSARSSGTAASTTT